jgi:hypothetical protein
MHSAYKKVNKYGSVKNKNNNKSIKIFMQAQKQNNTSPTFQKIRSVFLSTA